MVTEVHLAI